MTDTIMRKVTEDEFVKEKAIARDKFLHWQASIERQRKRQEAEKAELLQQLAEFAEIKRQLKHAIQGMAAAGMNAAQIAETIGMQEAEVEQYLS